jgi:hypothetical protein
VTPDSVEAIVGTRDPLDVVADFVEFAGGVPIIPVEREILGLSLTAARGDD